MLVVAASSSALVRTIAVAVIKMDAVISSSGSICSQFLRGGNLIGPSTLTDCLDSDGNLDADKCHRLLSEEADFVALHHAESAAAFAKHILEDDEDDYDDRGPPAPKKRRGERGALFYADVDGVLGGISLGRGRGISRNSSLPRGIQEFLGKGRGQMPEKFL